MNILIETIGWMGSILIVGSYALNIRGKLPANSTPYILANLVGGICFLIHTFVHKAYPSVAVNAIWIVFAVMALTKKKA